VMQRMPTHMLLDDHELFDNWEQLPDAPKAPAGGSVRSGRARPQLGSPAAERHRSRLETAKKQGLRAFLRYQRMGAAPAVPGSADSRFSCGGHAFLLLDTRSARWRAEPTPARPKATDPTPPQPTDGLISKHQQRLLKHWFEKCRGRVKFIATPSALLPRRELSARHAANAAMSDAWCGFPNSLYWLLDLMLSQEIDSTVFLSGDEHHSYVAEITVTRAGSRPLNLISVHSSALYAPFPFANGKPADLCGTEDFLLPGHNGDIHLSVVTWVPEQPEAPHPPSDGVALLHLSVAGGSPHLCVEFVGADGSYRDRWNGPVR